MRLTALLVVLAALPVAHAELVTNGTFEADAVGGSYATVGVGGSGLTGWSVIGSDGQNIAILSDGYLGQFSQQLDLSGTSDSPGSGIAQTLATVPGTQYVLTFDAFTAIAPYTASFDVFLDGSNVQSVSNVNAPYSIGFTATSTSTVLSFVGVSGNVCHIDNVSVEAVPEPASMAVFGIGLAALKRRRASRR